jgi:predicted acyltransferase
VFQVVIRATTATLALAIAIGAADAQSQAAIEPTGEAPSRTDMPAVTAVYRDDLVRIDGWLDEPLWQDASVASSFIQREPALRSRWSRSSHRRTVRGELGEHLHSEIRLFDRVVDHRAFDHSAGDVVSAPRTAGSVSTRLASLDAFRGLSIAGMILVNNPGSWSHVYPPLLHAEWHGWTPTDLIFPFFLFIVGVAMSFSLDARLERGEERRRLFNKIVKRSVIIVGLGLILSGFPRYDLETIRIPGVLQRIGVVYFFAALVVLYGARRVQVATATALLLGYWAVMMLVPTPGFGSRDLSPDGNLAAYVDRVVFGGHIWRETWDPEGLLSTFPAIATTLCGAFTGWLLRSGKPRSEIAGWMFVLGWAGILLGLVWNLAFPINKNLWTSSYVVFTAGAALHLLAVCYWLIDIKGWRRWARPAIVFGLNAIAVFVLSGLFVKTLLVIRVSSSDGPRISLYGWLYENAFVPWAGPLNGSLAFALANIGLWYGLMYLLYRKRIFIKI